MRFDEIKKIICEIPEEPTLIEQDHQFLEATSSDYGCKLVSNGVYFLPVYSYSDLQPQAQKDGDLENGMQSTIVTSVLGSKS